MLSFNQIEVDTQVISSKPSIHKYEGETVVRKLRHKVNNLSKNKNDKEQLEGWQKWQSGTEGNGSTALIHEGEGRQTRHKWLKLDRRRGMHKHLTKWNRKQKSQNQLDKDKVTKGSWHKRWNAGQVTCMNTAGKSCRNSRFSTTENGLISGTMNNRNFPCYCHGPNTSLCGIWVAKTSVSIWPFTVFFIQLILSESSGCSVGTVPYMLLMFTFNISIRHPLKSCLTNNLKLVGAP